jgi:ganglioside-induced differentiation-associated protein 1
VPHFVSALKHYDLMLAEMEERLTASDFLCAPEYSLADAAATPYVNRAAMLGLDFLWRDKDHGKHRLQEWFERMQNRSSFEKAVASLFTDQQRQMFLQAREQEGKKLHAFMATANRTA